MRRRGKAIVKQGWRGFKSFFLSGINVLHHNKCHFSVTSNMGSTFFLEILKQNIEVDEVKPEE